jgi:molecular chaperone GrpE
MTQKIKEDQAEAESTQTEDNLSSASEQQAESNQTDAKDDDQQVEAAEHEDEQQEDLKDQLLRVLAENENLRKRTQRDVASAKKYGALGLARDLLPSIDNLESAIALIPEEKADMDETLKNILIGVEMTGRELVSVLERHQISKIMPEGEKFDYNFHQAMFEVPTDDVPQGMVVQVVQPGYILHDRLLRPAMVGVSKPTDGGSSQEQ